MSTRRSGSRSGSRSRSGGGRGASGSRSSGGRSSSGRSSGGRGGSSGRRPPPRRSGGGATGTIIAALLLLGIIAVFFITSGKDKKTESPQMNSPELTADSNKPAEGPKVDTGPTRMPPPVIDPSMKDTARALAEKIKDLTAKGNAVYNSAMESKNSGDLDTWQEKLGESREFFQQAVDMWNEEIIANMPTNDDWDEEMVATKYLAKESNAIAEAQKTMMAISKQYHVSSD